MVQPRRLDQGPPGAEHPAHGTGDGSLDGGKRLLDSTSGNMGIAYATFGAALGVPVTLALPANASPERIAILRALGAELILTDPLEGSDGAHPRGTPDGSRAARALLLRQPVRQPGQLAGALPHHRPGDRPADRRAGHAFRRRAGHLRHADRGRALPAPVQPRHPAHRRAARLALPRAGRAEAHAHRHPTGHLRDRPARPHGGDPHRGGLRDGAQRWRARKACSWASLPARLRVAALQVAQELEQGVVVTVFPDAGYKYLSDKELWEVQCHVAHGT